MELIKNLEFGRWQPALRTQSVKFPNLMLPILIQFIEVLFYDLFVRLIRKG